LSQNDLSEHGIPERRSITHGSEAKGKKKMQLYAHDWMYKSIAIIFNVQIVRIPIAIGTESPEDSVPGVISIFGTVTTSTTKLLALTPTNINS